MAIELPVAPEHPGRLLARLARQVELSLAAVDLTLPQYRVLILLCERKEAASVLAEKLAVSRPSVTGVVDGLVARGLVRRLHDPDDRRRVGVVLTPAGRRVLADADRDVQRRLHEIAGYAAAGADMAFAGLVPWLEALEGHRDACRAAAAGLAAETAAAGAAR